MLARSSPSRGRSQSVRGDAPPDRARGRNGRVPLPASQRTLHLDPGHIPSRQRRSRPSLGIGRRLGRYQRAQIHRDRVERHAAAPAISALCQSRHHLHHKGFRRFRLHLRQREPPRDHGLFAGGDDHRSEMLARPSPPRGRRPRVRGYGIVDRPRRRQHRVSLPSPRRPLHLDPGQLQGRQGRGRQRARAGRRLGRHHREQGGRAGGAQSQSRAARHQALSVTADRELDRRHHRHRQGRQCRPVQRGRRDAAGLSRRGRDG